MRDGLDPFSFLVVSIAGWMNQRQQQVSITSFEENRVLREQIGNRRMRFTDTRPLDQNINDSLLGSPIRRRVTLRADFCLASQIQSLVRILSRHRTWCLRKPLWLLPVCCRKESGKGRKSPEDSACKPLNLMKSI